MGLESFSTSRENAVGDVKSRKKLENLTIDREHWWVIVHELNAQFPISVAEEMTNEELKAMIKLYDAEIDEENFFSVEGMDEESFEEIKSNTRARREDLVDILEAEDEAEEAEA